MADDVTTELTSTTASATGVVDAPPDAVFDYLRRPANHPEISGNGSVQGTRVGPDVLGAVGEKFGMKMKQGLPYNITNKVVRYEENRVISWAHMMGNTWTWELEPTDDGRTTVTEVYDQGPAKAGFLLKIMGYPKGHVDNVAKSVANVRDHFAS